MSKHKTINTKAIIVNDKKKGDEEEEGIE